MTYLVIVHTVREGYRVATIFREGYTVPAIYTDAAGAKEYADKMNAIERGGMNGGIPQGSRSVDDVGTYTVWERC